MPSTTAAQPKTATAAAWKKAKFHDVVCPSGVTVTLKIPDLPKLIQTGAIPNNLLDAAIGAVKGTAKIDRDFVLEEAEFINKLVCLTVVSPEITEADCVGDDSIPVEDKEMIAEIATRQRDIDALGHHLAGLHQNSDFRAFRGLSPLYEDVEGL